jgi:hypothetical protein
LLLEEEASAVRQWMETKTEEWHKTVTELQKERNQTKSRDMSQVAHLKDN